MANAAFEAGDQTNTAKYCEEAKKLGVSASERAEAFAEGGIQGFDLDYKYSREEQGGLFYVPGTVYVVRRASM